MNKLIFAAACCLVACKGGSKGESGKATESGGGERVSGSVIKIDGSSTVFPEFGLLAAGPAQAADTIRVLSPTWPGFAPVLVASDLGYFKEMGLTVDMKFEDDRANVMAAMARGDIEVDMRTVGEHQGRPRDASTPGIIIGTIDKSLGGDGVIADGSITSVADLKGKTIAGSRKGSGNDAILRVLLLREQAKLEPDRDVQIVGMGEESKGEALLEKKVDAAFLVEPFVTIQKKAGVNIPQVYQSASALGMRSSQGIGRSRNARHAAFWAADMSPSVVQTRKPKSQSRWARRDSMAGTYGGAPQPPPRRPHLAARRRGFTALTARVRRASQRKSRGGMLPPLVQLYFASLTELPADSDSDSARRSCGTSSSIPRSSRPPASPPPRAPATAARPDTCRGCSSPRSPCSPTG